MNRAEHWDQFRGVIRTRKGGWQIGKGVTSYGHSLLGELMPGHPFFSVLILNVTGTLPEPRLARWFEAFFIAMSWPDPRMWCNFIGALGGSVRATPIASIAAGVCASDSAIYGPGTIPKSCEFIATATADYALGVSVGDIVEREQKLRGVPAVPGYYRPFAKGDERVGPIHTYATKVLAFGEGAHLQMAQRVHDYLEREYQERMNLAGYITAFLLDQGMTPAQIHVVSSFCTNAGIHACYAEQANDRPPGSILPLRCDDIDYIGVAPRTVDR